MAAADAETIVSVLSDSEEFDDLDALGLVAMLLNPLLHQALRAMQNTTPAAAGQPQNLKEIPL